jgi:DNA-binding NtrC family response regulator
MPPLPLDAPATSVLLVDTQRGVAGSEPLASCHGSRGVVAISRCRRQHGGSGGELRVREFARDDIPALLSYVRGIIELPAADAAESILGVSRDMARVRNQVRSVSRFNDISVLVLGETGTGKDVVARAIHQLSNPAMPYVPINSAAIPESLFESELFGHEAGSYTGARTRRGGLLEMAGAGTLFLDEIGDMPASLQPKLLRAVESRSFRRVGSNVDLPLRARIVSATNRRIDEGSGSSFRPDLLYRLAGFVIELSPLRRRVDDILPLSRAFLAQFAKRYDLDDVPLTADAEHVLLTHSWPGNVRQLRTALEHAAILASGRDVHARHIEDALRPSPSERVSRLPPPPATGVSRSELNDVPPTLKTVESDLIRRAWEQNDGNVSRTARQLGIARSTLRDRLRRYGIAQPRD